MMGHIFQAEWWARHPRGVFIWLFMAKEIEKGNGKGIKEEKRYFGTFIYENNGN